MTPRGRFALDSRLSRGPRRRGDRSPVPHASHANTGSPGATSCAAPSAPAQQWAWPAWPPGAEHDDRGRRRRAAAGNAAVAGSSSPRPTGPAGLPLPRTDYSVTWAITDDNPPIKEGLKPEGGTLNVFNYADYIWPGLDQALREAVRLQGQDRDLQLRGRGDGEALGRRGRLRRRHRPQRQQRWCADRAAADAAAHAQLPAESREEHLGRRCRTRSTTAARATRVPYVVWLDGIGWRNDKIGNDIAGDEGAVGHLLGVEALDGQGRDPGRRARRARDADAARRDARGRGSRISTPRTRRSSPRPAATSRSSRASATSRSTITDYQTLPEGKSWLHHAWSGDLLVGGALLPAQEHEARRCSRSGALTRAASCRTTCSGCSRSPRSPCSRTRSSTSCSTRRTPTTTSCSSSATRRRRTRSTATSLVKQGLIPKSLATAVLRPDQFANNQELLALSVEGSKLWQNAWAKFKAG